MFLNWPKGFQNFPQFLDTDTNVATYYICIIRYIYIYTPKNNMYIYIYTYTCI